MNRKEIGKSPGDLPLGGLVESTTPGQLPGRKRYKGKYVNLHPVDPEPNFRVD